MRVLLTGATSFTGCWIARALLDKGVQGLTIPSRNTAPSSLIQKRVSLFSQHSHVQHVTYSGFESASFHELLQEVKPDVLINHGAYMEQYRTPNYRVDEAVRINVIPLRPVIETFARCGGRLFVQTGSVFEPGEGGLDRDDDSGESPYGIVKSMTSKMAQFWCAQSGISFLKIVIPNPIGPLENEDRLFPVAMRLWKNGEPLVISDPDTVRDNIPVTWLAQSYAMKVADVFHSSLKIPRTVFFRPSGMVSSNDMLIRTFASEMESRFIQSSLKARVVVDPNPRRPSQKRVNSDPVLHALGLNKQKAEHDFWSSLASEYSI